MENQFYISLPLIQKLDDLKTNEPDSTLISFIETNGLPTTIQDESLKYYLYLHQMLIPFYPILSKIKSDEVKKVLMDSLKQNILLLSDVKNKHFNFDFISNQLKGKITEKKDENEISQIPVFLKKDEISTQGKFILNENLVKLGEKGKGRLDIYVKAHIIKSIILFLGISELTAFITNFQTMEDDLLKVAETAEKEKFTMEKYNNMVILFSNGEKRDEWYKILPQLKKLLIVFQNVNDKESIENLERLYIQLLGHFERELRNEAVKVLTMIYDESNWQDKNAYNIKNTKIKLLDDDVTLELAIKKGDYTEQEIVLITNSPCENENVKGNVITFLKSQDEKSDGDYTRFVFNFGKVTKCGYYDWYLAKFDKGRYSNVKIIKDDESIDGKGRFIVLDNDIKDLSVHEVFCDLIDARIDKGQGRITQRGTFKSLENKLDEYNHRYVNCLYIMGALERDNEIAYDENTGEALDFANRDASPMAITCRSAVSSLLGGDKAFRSLMGKAKRLSMKVILDSLARISSARHYRIYRDILLHSLDSKGKKQICYGTDGAAVQYDDSAVLNYRKKDAWDLLINEIKSLIEKYGIDGVHLDNCQAWPQIMEIDAAEMYRNDIDGKPAYSPMEIMNGEIVMPNEESGFYNSDAGETYANPFLIKLTKEIWKYYPHFVFFGECWITGRFANRHVVLSKSGVIPRMYTLPILLSEILGKKIQRDGHIDKIAPHSVETIKEWYNENYKGLPEGAVLVQSSSGQIWPYPALLYGRGNWAAVDLLFTLPDVPMTFMNEIDGEAYRVKIVNVYERKDTSQLGGSSTANLTSKKRSKSLMRLIESKQQEQRERETTKDNSENTSGSPSVTNLSNYVPSYDLNESISTLIQLSGVELNKAVEIEFKQQQLVNELGPKEGFDLTKIKFHYDHRRKMRYSHECLRRGKLIYLNALDDNGKQHFSVFAFARQTVDETGIFAINFSENETTFKLDLTNLLKITDAEGNVTDEELNFNAICYIENWFSEEKGDFYFVRELVQGHVNRKIEPYGTLCFGFSIIPFTQENYKYIMERSIARMISEIKTNGPSVDSYQVSIQLREILEKNLPLEEFGKWMNYIFGLLEKLGISFEEYIRKLGFIWTDEKLSTGFFKYCFKMQQLKDALAGTPNAKIPEVASNMFNSNVLGPICFVTPELGRWSTVGGLGVMVDELSQGLQQLGQELIMISPYYDRNRKGQSDYLANDPFNIKYLQNTTVKLDGEYTFGVHMGEGNGGIKYYFLHNYKIFPRPYPDGSCEYTLRQICLFCKGSLQLLCDLNKIPAVIMTNDWFTGLTAAYAKKGHFGDTFNGTTFFHICHNLQPTYEGRLYPSPEQGTLDNIHQLPSECLVDPWWKNTVINPSRCALMMSDQWGTVSYSYRDELLSSSPLAPILKMKPRPFAFPNGIFKEKRLKDLKEKAGGDRNECKRYIQKKYFGYGDADFSVPIYSFVGRLTQQKGVLMILDAAEEIIRKTSGKVNILVGGMGSPGDPYVAACIGKINYLKGKYPYAFWADPNEFFTDGPKINLGSDFGLMPSLFEPGGIVQHEFFIAGTPVIAFKTGGLRDTVFEFQWDTNTGNGFTFETYNPGDLIYAISRSLDLFANKEKYEICRKNAFNSAIDVATVSRAWCREFYRLKNKIFFNTKEVLDTKLDPAEKEQAIKELKELHPNEAYVLGRKETEEFAKKQAEMLSSKKAKNFTIAPPSVIVDGEIRIPMTFSYQPEGPKPSSVQICGSFDKWQVRHPLKWDDINMKFTVTLKMKRGQYFYKYIVDGNWVVNYKEPTNQGSDGIVNNTVNL
jgi:starch synthase